MAFDLAAKRRLFEAVGNDLPDKRPRRGGKSRLSDLSAEVQADISEAQRAGLPVRPRSGRAGGLVSIEQSGRSGGALDDLSRLQDLSHAAAFVGRQLRGRWMHPSYTKLRNAAWMARHARRGAAQSPVALQLVLYEVEQLVMSGEKLPDIIEALAELLMQP